MASSFAVGLASAPFTVVYQQPNDYQETWDGPIGNLDCSLLIVSAADENTLRGLRSWSVNERPIPGGSNAYVDIAGGAGAGTLTIDNHPLSPLNAYLKKMSRPTAYPDGKRVVKATFRVWP